MEKKIDIAAILKDCPRGMELDCTTWENVTFEEVRNDVIIIIRNNKQPYVDSVALNKYGRVTSYEDEKCRIFPKGKTTWEGFQRPFKSGDIVCYMDAIAIFKEWGDETLFRTYVATYLCCDSLIDVNIPFYGKSVRKEIRLATEKEKEKLFQAIKDNGYKWNERTKTLEKLIKPKFKVGDKIVNDDYVVEIIDMDIEGEVYGYKSKVGATGGILFIEQDEWELVPNKFDPTTLKPYDKVLARCSSLEKWRIQFFEKFDKTCKFPFICMGYNKYKQCIPYEGNEHLLDTADSCSDYYLI